MLSQKTKKHQKIISCFSICGISIFLLSMLLLPIQAQVIADSDFYYGDILAISNILYKDTDEIDPNYDYYSINGVLAEQGGYQNDPDAGPLSATIRIAVPLSAIEPPGSHSPSAGWSWSQTDFRFTFFGIGYWMRLPAYEVTYNSWTDANFRYFDWEVSSFNDLGGAWGFIFNDYTDFSVGIRVPQDYTMQAWIGGYINIYEKTFPTYTFVDSESYYWTYTEYGPGEKSIQLPKELPIAPKMSELPKEVRMCNAMEKR